MEYSSGRGDACTTYRSSNRFGFAVRPLNRFFYAFFDTSVFSDIAFPKLYPIYSLRWSLKIEDSNISTVVGKKLCCCKP